MNKCLGCGNIIDDDKKYCERCFNIKNYNYHDKLNIMDNNLIIDNINNQKYFTLFLCDIFSLNNKIVELYQKINNNKIFIITKSDLIPKNIYLNVLVNNIKKVYNIQDILFISIKNNMNINEIKNIINKYEKVILTGNTSSGKSSLINYLYNLNITVSKYQNTTVINNEIKIDNLKIIDTPGFNIDFLINENKEAGCIKPKTLFLKEGYSLNINNNVISFDKDVNLTLYFYKDINIKSFKNSNKLNNNILLKGKSDILINNIGFIYLNDHVKVFFDNHDNIEIRESIVGKYEQD